MKKKILAVIIPLLVIFIGLMILLRNGKQSTVQSDEFRLSIQSSSSNINISGYNKNYIYSKLKEWNIHNYSLITYPTGQEIKTDSVTSMKIIIGQSYDAGSFILGVTAGKDSKIVSAGRFSVQNGQGVLEIYANTSNATKSDKVNLIGVQLMTTLYLLSHPNVELNSNEYYQTLKTINDEIRANYPIIDIT